jgi:rRNA maturation RNase YbeY
MASHSKSKVYFFFPFGDIFLKNRTSLKKFIEGIFKIERKYLKKLNYVFCSDRDLLRLNKKYLSHDFYTDILTFDLSEDIQTQADIYISVDRVKENSQKRKTTFIQELHRVIFHGALHLCGYGDKSIKEISLMRKREDYYLSIYFK